MKRLLSLAAAAALAASPAFAQNGPAAGSKGGVVAQNVQPIGDAAIPAEALIGVGALVLILLAAGAGGSDSTTSTPSSPPS